MFRGEWRADTSNHRINIDFDSYRYLTLTLLHMVFQVELIEH